MKRFYVTAASLVVSALGSMISMVGCDEGVDAVVSADSGTTTDGSFESSTGGDSGVSSDAGPKADATGDATTDAGPQGRPPWLLASVNYQTQSELIAYSIGAKDVDGRLTYAGGVGMTYIDSLGRAWLLEQSTDRVVELDPLAPWKERASWDVHLGDAVDGGSPNADPVMVVPTSAGKAYVVRFNRNRIAVIDDTLVADASAPTKTIDLSSFLDPSDTDTSVDPVGAAVVDGKLYVLLGNLDLNKVSPTGYFTICTATKPKVIVIDPATDTIGPVVDGGVAGGTELPGYNPNFNGLWYDAPRHRLLALNGGCNPELGDGGKGALERREVDAIDVTTGVATKVLDLDAEGFPSAAVRASADEVILGFDFAGAKRWTVTSASLGAALPGSLAAFTIDKSGTVYGIQTTYLADGGSNVDLVSLPNDGGAPNVLGPLPASQAGGFAGAIDFVPSP